MNSIWNKNYSAFKSRFPSLCSLMKLPSQNLEELTPLWTISEAKNGQVTLSENGLRLHSAYNPQREAQGAVSVPQIQQFSTAVFYGFGLGYHLTEFCKLYPSKKMVVVEPDVNHFFAAMMVTDWSEVFAHQQLVLAVGCPSESVLQLIEEDSTVNPGNMGVSDAYFFEIPAFMAHARPYFDTVISLVKRNQRKNEINAATLKKFGHLWCKNSLANLDAYKNLASVSIFENKAAVEMPFLIVGAGPTLEKILPFAAELKKRFLIVCVETALHALQRSSVQPDFVILTDPQFWAYRHIAGLKAPQSILITEISAYPSVFRFDCKKIMLCSSQFLIGQYFEKQLELKTGDLGTGGSVASSAWNFARFCGAARVFVAGLDFAFPGKQTHIKGSSAEQTYLTIGNRLASSDKFTSAAIYSANGVVSKNYNGAPVLTDSRMKMFSWWFEARLANCPETKTFTLGPEGLNTPGITPSSIEQALSLPDITQIKKVFLENADKAAPVLSDKTQEFEDLKQVFPTKEFLQQFPFLKDYL